MDMVHGIIETLATESQAAPPAGIGIVRPPEQVPWFGDRDGVLRQSRFEFAGRQFRVAEGGAGTMGGNYVWPATVMLAREAERMDVRGFTVLDLGCGTGLVGMILAARGAFVAFADRDPDTCERLRATLAFNGLSGSVACLDWSRDTLMGPFDSILSCETLYGTPQQVSDLAKVFFRAWTGKGKAVVVASSASNRHAFSDAVRELGMASQFETFTSSHHDGRAFPWHRWELSRAH